MENGTFQNNSQSHIISLNSSVNFHAPFSSNEKNKNKYKIYSRNKKLARKDDNKGRKFYKKIRKLNRIKQYIHNINRDIDTNNFDLLDDDNLTITSKEFECGICKKFLVSTIMTSCGHSFCQICINEWVINSNKCSYCQFDLRSGLMIPNLNLDEIIKTEIQKKSVEVQKDYNKRLNEFIKSSTEHKKNLEKLKVGNLLDVRDTEFIWCVGEVTNVVKCENTKALKSIFIHYLGWNSEYDEQIDLESPRIATLGFYTMRTNIPMYKFDDKKKNERDSFVAYLLYPNGVGKNYKKMKSRVYPNLPTCEEYYHYENSKVCD